MNQKNCLSSKWRGENHAHLYFSKEWKYFGALDKSITHGFHLERLRKQKHAQGEQISFAPVNALGSIALGIMKTSLAIAFYSAAVYLPPRISTNQIEEEADQLVMFSGIELSNSQIKRIVPTSVQPPPQPLQAAAGSITPTNSTPTNSIPTVPTPPFNLALATNEQITR